MRRDDDMFYPAVSVLERARLQPELRDDIANAAPGLRAQHGGHYLIETIAERLLERGWRKP